MFLSYSTMRRINQHKPHFTSQYLQTVDVSDISKSVLLVLYVFVSFSTLQ